MEDIITEKKIFKLPIKGQTNERVNNCSYAIEESKTVKFEIPANFKATIVIESDNLSEQLISKCDGLNNYDLVDNNKETILRRNSIVTESTEYTYSKIDATKSHEINVFKFVSKIKEEESMKREYQKRIFNKQAKFLLLSFSLIIIALINLIMFSIGRIYINPYISIFILIMGLGWGATAIASIFEK